MKRGWRHFVILLQIVALVTFPQIGGAQSSEVGVDDAHAHDIDSEAFSHDHSTSHYHEHSISQSAHHHDGDQVAGLDKSASWSGYDNRGLKKLICHPCCVDGKGACVVIITDLPNMSRPTLIREFGSTLLYRINSRLVVPLLHPPQVHI